MKEEKDKLRDLMKEVFDDYTVAPDPEDWNRIEKSLHKVKGRRYIIWAIWPAAASLLLLIALYTGGILNHTDNTAGQLAINQNKTTKGSATITINTNLSSKVGLRNRTVNKQLATNQPSEEKTQQNKVKGIASSTIRKNNNSNINKKVQSQPEKIKNIRSSKRLNQKVNSQDTKSTLLGINQIKQSRPVLSIGKVLNSSTFQSGDTLYTIQNNHLLVHSIIPKRTELIKYNSRILHYDRSDLKYLPIKGHLTGDLKDALANNGSNIHFKGLSLNNTSGFIAQTSKAADMSYSGVFASQLASNMYLNSVKAFDNSYLASLDIGNLFQNNSRDYFPPVTFGMDINLSLQGNWSIETGIEYTRLQSNGVVSIKASNAVQFTTSYGYKVDESLHYLGVPVIINYNFSQKRKTSYYISAGFSIDKGIIAKYKATPQDNLPGMQPIYSHNAIKGLQYSINSGIGISYKFIQHFELFGQPSVSYYFNSEGKNTTIYSVHPIIFNLRTGIRYAIK